MENQKRKMPSMKWLGIILLLALIASVLYYLLGR